MSPHRDSLRDFDRARRKAFIQGILSLLTRRPLDLLPYDQVRKQLRLYSRHFRGLQEVPLDQIVGSVGRYRDFTRTFLPRSSDLRERWATVEDRVKEGGLPPVELYQVGDAYFVRDGNHRVSVARVQGAPTIEAYVWEYPSLVSLTPDDDLDDLLIKREYVIFLTKTDLKHLRPDQRVEFTASGRYRDLIEHIEVHRHYLRSTASEAVGQERGQEVPYQQAVTSWYDNVYLPIVQAIGEYNVLSRFPGRTEADLYIWISRWQYELSERYGQPVSAKEAVGGFADQRPFPDKI